MARGLRLVYPGVPLHLVQRGNNRGPCFAGDDDYQTYLAMLLQASTQIGCAVHAYVLMTNHVHLLVTPPSSDGASRLMQQLGRRYVRSFNKRHGRSGTLWEGRFHSSVIGSERYFLTCQRYIEQNPVRAGLACDAGTYRWSSHLYYAQGRPDPLLTAHACFQQLADSPAERRESYRRLFDSEVSDEALEYIRRGISRGRPLGRPAVAARPSPSGDSARL